MTDQVPGENNIESLAQRAKEVLDRVRSTADEVHVEPTLEEFDLEGLDDLEASPLLETTLGVDELSERDAVPDADELPDIEEADSDVEDAPDEEVEGEEEDDADEGAALASASLAAATTFDAASLQTGKDETGDEAEEDDDKSRRFGCLIPLLVLALVVLALVLFWGRLFEADDDASLADDPTAVTTTTLDDPDETSSSAESNTTSSTATTTSTAAPTTTEAPPVIPDSAWQLLGETTNTDQFAAFGVPLGLQEDLESRTGTDGFTLLAPTNEAMAGLSAEQVAALGRDPASAKALLEYHFIDQRLTPELLLSAAGTQINTRVGLPIDVALDGDDIILNGQARVDRSALEAGNGNVVVIDSVLQPPTINSVIGLGQVQFEVISAIITSEGEAELQKLVAFFKENPDVNAAIEGHTDTDGPAEPNQRLSQRRSDAVRNFLISQGIDGSRLTAEGFGETQPIIVNGAEDKAASRRIELNIR